MKIRILNLLIALAVVLNVWYGWKVGLLYGRNHEPEAGITAACSRPCLNIAIKTVETNTYDQSKEMEILNQKIAEVAEQLARMNLPPDTVLVIRTEGTVQSACAGPILNTGQTGHR